MGYLVLAGAITLAAIIALGIFFFTPKHITKTDYSDYPAKPKDAPNPVKWGAAAAAVGLIVTLGLVTAIAAVARVEAREVGVETLFGKYQRTLQPGWQWQNPMASVETFDTKLQTTDVNPAVGFSGGGGGNQPATVQWEITSEEAEALWRDFGTFEDVKNRLVIKTTDDTIDRVMKGYSPSQVLQDDNAAKIRDAVKDRLAERLEPYGITVRDVLMPTPSFDPKSKEYLDRVQASEANLRRSEIDKQTALNDAEADKIRNREASPESLTLECLDTMRTWNDDNNGPLPAGFQCMSGAGGNVQLVKPVE